MDSPFKQLKVLDKKLLSQEPQKINESNNDIAILIHVFYIDIWDELKCYLDQLEIGFDLYITVTNEMNDDDIFRIIENQPNAHIFMLENRGRDVLPFLQVVSLFNTNTYSAICKLHTKKTGSSDLGNVWRKLLYFDLIGSSTVVNDILNLFGNHPEIKIITGKNTTLDSETYDFGNASRVKMLAKKADIEYRRDYLFPAGTMFWVKPDLLEAPITLLKNGDLNFEEEKGQKDNTLAHAIERFFGLLCQVNHQKIVESPSLYSQLDDKTLDRLSSLVLSQQYIDFDKYTKALATIKERDDQIQEKIQQIHKRDTFIKELEELAQSLRIKNRLKRLSPKRLLAPFKIIQKNPALLKKVLYYAKRGEFSYLLDKVREKSKKNISQSANFVKINPADYFKSFSIDDYPMGDRVIDIIIPVYNGYQFLTPLFDSIEKNTTSPYRLIVVNDCSPDEKVKPLLLERLQKHPTAIFIDHEVNLGFVKSVNEAYSHTSSHFLILNTDTEVPAFWLERLMHPIVNMEKIATTTPFTNSGQIASFPSFIADNDIFEGMNVDALDSVFREVNPDKFYTHVPTGVGFCMGVNYNLIQEIGFFVEEEFGRGYGEENDWCQRAIKHGYTNLMVPNLFVYHKHGGSFSAEDKQQLMKENAIKLLHKHPNYDKDVEAYVRKDPHQTLRNILVIIAASQHKEGIHLMIDQALGGGANHYTKELVQNDLQKEKKVLRLIYDYYAHTYVIHFDYKTYHFSYSLSGFEEVRDFVSHLKLQEIFINNLVSFPDPDRFLQWIETLIRQEPVKLVIPIHDYYPICPNYTLLDPQGVFCEIPDSLQECQTCMQKNDLEWKTFTQGAVDIYAWRREWGTLLELSDTIICFSNSSKELLLRAYKELDRDKIEITPHQVSPLDPVTPPLKANKSYTTIGILGAINQAKGAEVIEELARTIDAKNLPIKIVLIGEISKNISSDSFLVTGRYQREDLPQLVLKHEIDIFLIPSVCPETFSYTTQEIMMMEMPVMVFDLGAPAERVVNYSQGYIIDEINPVAILETIEKIKTELKSVTI